MSFQVAGHQTENYRIQTEVYSGPLDLLLDLIERAELDITRLAIAQVTDQYLAYLEQLTEHDPAELSAFLVMAARLVQIKAAALLPRPALPPTIIEEEDLGEALARQLLLYKRFKQLSEGLRQREDAGLRTYLRLAAPPKIQTRADMSGLTLADMVLAARDAFFNQSSLPPLNDVVSRQRVTIREKIDLIITALQRQGSGSFVDLLPPGRSRLEIVVTFLALLELVKRHLVEAEQTSLFSDIALHSQGQWDDQQELDLEFGE
jgi:segregation and condensation protein A